MKNLIRLAVVVSNAFLLIACSPEMPDLTTADSTQRAEQKQHFKWAERKPFRKVKLAGGFFISQQLDSNLPKEQADMPISIKFSGRVGTVGDIVFMLEQKGLPVSYNWTVYENNSSSMSGGMSANLASDEGLDFDEGEFGSSSSGSEDSIITAINSLENRIVPFKSYKGTLDGLLKRLQRSMNISYWWEEDTVFLSTNQEYVVSVPQQQEIIQSISDEIAALGATNITSSLTAGQIVYYAKPRAQESLIKPFLQRVSHNLSEITLQVALVNVEINDAKSKGFDWSAFDVSFGAPAIDGGADNHTSTVNITPYNGDSSNPSGEIAGSFFRKGISIFGTETDVNVDLAINILSTIGKTTTEQNVEMRTISGKEVTLSSVAEESYVSGYDGGTTGDNAEPASPEFDTVETGLTLTLLPVFDAYNAIITVDSKIELSTRGEDTTVDAGTGFEQITVRPNINKDSFEDVVRIPVGETVIVGGIMRDRTVDSRTAPYGVWELNSAKIVTTKEALFLIIRPLVTLYETEGNEMKTISEEGILERTKYNYGKAVEKMQEDEEKAKQEAEEKARIEAEKAEEARIKAEEEKRIADAAKAIEMAKAKEIVDKKAAELAKKREAEAKREAKENSKIEKMKAKMEKEYQAELAKKEAEAAKLKAEMEEHKKTIEVLEAENEWVAPDEEEVVEIVEEALEAIPASEKVAEKTTSEVELTEEEAMKMQMLNMLRGVKQ